MPLADHPPALTQAIVLAGPRSLLPVAGRPFLGWLLREVSRFGIERVTVLGLDAVPDLALPRPMQVDCGPASLAAARAALDPRFLLLGSESLLDMPLGPLLTGGDAVALSAPLAALSPSVLDALPAGEDLWSGLARLARAGRLQSLAAQGWGVDLARADGQDRAQAELPGRLMRPALFLDRDGVCNIDHGWVGTRGRWEWVAGARAAIAAATRQGWHVFLVTNQSGIARGLYSEAAFFQLQRWVLNQVLAAGGTIDDVRHAPFHPQAPLPEFRRDSDWRKPGAGMLHDLIRAWQLDPARCVMVGDQPTDMQAAAAAGVPGHLFPGGDLAAFVAPLLKGFSAPR